jgi:hypothetical protein
VLAGHKITRRISSFPRRLQINIGIPNPACYLIRPLHIGSGEKHHTVFSEFELCHSIGVYVRLPLWAAKGMS